MNVVPDSPRLDWTSLAGGWGCWLELHCEERELVVERLRWAGVEPSTGRSRVTCTRAGVKYE